MSMVDTWSIWMATLSFIRADFPIKISVAPSVAEGPLPIRQERRDPSTSLRSARDDGLWPSVKPAAQFLQQGRGALGKGRIGFCSIRGEETLEGGDRGAALVEPG